MTIHRPTRRATESRRKPLRPYLLSVLVMILVLGSGEGLLRAFWKHPDKRVLTARTFPPWISTPHPAS
jgi:hypothetical protein